MTLTLTAYHPLCCVDVVSDLPENKDMNTEKQQHIIL